MPLSLWPQCDCLACVLFQHPQWHSLRLQGLGSWCKVNHTGGRKGKMARERARETEQAREAVCFLSPFRTRGSEKRKSSVSGHHHHFMVMWHRHMPQQHKQFLTWKSEACLIFYFLLGHESLNKSVLDAVESTLHLHQKRQICIKPANDLQGGLWRMVLRHVMNTQTLWTVLIKECFIDWKLENQSWCWSCHWPTARNIKKRGCGSQLWLYFLKKCYIISLV